MCGDSKTNNRPSIFFLLHKNILSYITCHMPPVTCHLWPVTCHLSPTPIATATDAPLANLIWCTVGWFTKTELWKIGTFYFHFLLFFLSFFSNMFLDQKSPALGSGCQQRGHRANKNASTDIAIYRLKRKLYTTFLLHAIPWTLLLTKAGCSLWNRQETWSWNMNKNQ